MKRRRLARRAAIAAAALIAAVMGERLAERWIPLPAAAAIIPPPSLILVAADGSELRWTTIDGERRRWLPLAQMSPALSAALIAGEDRRFADHAGVDWTAVARAVVLDALSGRRLSGASTISMQLARLIEPHPRTWLGKAVEAFRARQLERAYGKRWILEQYLNRVPWGGPLRGAEAASRWWFGRSAADLDAAQAAMLVALLPAPSRRSPLVTPTLTRDRRDRILRRMGLDDAALARALAEPLPREPRPFPWRAPHACDAALAAGLPADRDGVVHLDLDLARQEAVAAALADTAPLVDGVAVAVVDRAGRVRVHLGSSDWRARRFDAATARRPAGSTVKPFLYRLAFASGAAAPSSPLADAPLATRGWSPANEDGRFLGDLPAAEALARSRNPPAVRALALVGRDAFVGELLRDGIVARVGGLDAALGTDAMRPLDLAGAYAALLRGGDDDAAAAAVLAALRTRDLAPGAVAGERIAWKTGTSSQRRDAWCVAIDGDLVVVVWTGWLDGHGDPALLGREAARRLCAVVLATLEAA